MRKFFIVFLILVPAFFVNAEFVGPNTSPTYNSVKDVLNNPVDDTFVVLKGHIIKKLNNKKYLFKDGTGQITVEISYKRISHIHITQKTLVEIHGKIDVDHFPTNSVEIEVKHINVIKSG